MHWESWPKKEFYRRFWPNIFAAKRFLVVSLSTNNRSVYCIPPYTPLLYIPDKIRNATRRTDQLSGRSQVMGQLRLYRCKGISGTASLHIVCNQASKMWTRKLAKNQVGVKL